jgi:hypothetical protein
MRVSGLPLIIAILTFRRYVCIYALSSEVVMDERATSRVEVDRLIELQIGGRTGRALLYNLSMGGCMIEGPNNRVRLGDEVSLRLDDLINSTGRVVWHHGRYSGVRFEAEIHEAVVAHLGFAVSEASVAIDTPVDRFGRALPPLNG